MTRRHATLPIHAPGSAGATTVEEALHEVPGVLRVYVNAVIEMAYVEYDGERCDERALEAVLDREGYRGRDPQRTFSQRRPL